MVFQFDDKRKIGTLLLAVGFLFLFLGVLFFFDASLLSIGDILVLSGLTLTIGPQRTLKFFSRKSEARGIICFIGGIFMVLIRWPMIGMAMQSFGFLNLFGTFFPVAVTFMRATPVLGNILNLPIVSTVVDKLAGVGDKRLPI